MLSLLEVFLLFYALKKPLVVILPLLLNTYPLYFSSDPGRLLSLQGAWLRHSVVDVDTFLALLPKDEETHIRGV